MKTLLRLEEATQFLLCLVALHSMHEPSTAWSWWWWGVPLVLIGPDLGMIGYLFSPSIGAVSYNFTHHKGIPVVLGLSCFVFNYMDPDLRNKLIEVSVILYAHSSMDRMLGYGLKYSDNFKHTHLGWLKIGYQKA